MLATNVWKEKEKEEEEEEEKDYYNLHGILHLKKTKIKNKDNAKSKLWTSGQHSLHALRCPLLDLRSVLSSATRCQCESDSQQTEAESHQRENAWAHLSSLC